MLNQSIRKMRFSDMTITTTKLDEMYDRIKADAQRYYEISRLRQAA